MENCSFFLAVGASKAVSVTVMSLSHDHIGQNGRFLCLYCT